MRPESCVLWLLVCLSVSVLASPPRDTLTRAEASRFEETSRYDDVRALLTALAASDSSVRVTRFGHSEEGRELPLAVLAAPPTADPAVARASPKARVLVLANIHAGEVEGKEAALIVARRLAGGDLRQLLNRITVLIAPIYNADGNERISTANRPEQFGPVGGVGTRGNARGLDLNRDAMKLESAEARSLADLLNTWDPHVVVDLHATNGSYHGYHLTYAPTLAVGADPRIVDATRGLLDTASRLLVDRGWRTYYYGNFTVEGHLDRERPRIDDGAGAPAWRTFDARPRFVTNGVGLRNRIAILSEAYSYLSFDRRVGVTEAFVEAVLVLAARRASSLTALVADVDRETSAAGRDGTLGPLGTRGQLAVREEGAVRILVGEVDTRPHPRTGTPMKTMREGSARQVLMQDYGRFAPVDAVLAPKAYVVPATRGMAPLIDRLATLLGRHGVKVERLTGPSTLHVEAVTPARVERGVREFQGHREVHLVGARRAERALDVPAGSLLVPMGQPLARLAFHLLEPTSDDGVVTWNVLDDWLADGTEVPVYRVLR